jgi:hypothetical protein
MVVSMATCTATGLMSLGSLKRANLSMTEQRPPLNVQVVIGSTPDLAWLVLSINNYILPYISLTLWGFGVLGFWGLGFRV